MTDSRDDHRRRWPALRAGVWMPIILSLALTGCRGNQSILDPRGPGAELISWIWWGMFAVGAAIFLYYSAMLLVGLFPGLIGRKERPPGIDGTKMIVGGGVVLPVVVFVALTIVTALAGRELTPPSEEEESDADLVIEVTGRQWWWQVRYPHDEPSRSFETANEIRIPVGERVRLRLRSADVIHSFWVPNLQGKIDMIPARTNVLELTADEPGIYRGQCNQYCGAQHAKMAFHLVAEPRDAYEAWAERQRRPAARPQNAFLDRGRQAFLSGGCTFCHTVDGIAEDEPTRGSVAPNLTHVGSRLTIGAGILRNTQGNLQAWIVDNQHLKPENHMPDYNHFSGNDLRALAAYLESLK